jgi:hypothetical protein
MAPAFLIVALLAFLLPAGPLPAQAGSGPGAADPTSAPTAAVEGVITGIDGMVVQLLGGVGGLSIDLSHARIVYAGADADDTAVPPITPGSHLLARVEVPAVQAGGTPGPLVATFAVIRLAKTSSLRGEIESVSVPEETFTMLSRIIHVDSKTVFAGGSAKGPVKSLADLEPGMVADATLTVAIVDISTPVLLAVRVVAHGPVKPPEAFTFRGLVKSIGGESWTIDDKVVFVTTDTKIVGDPKVGDLVVVLATIENPPNPGMGMPSRLVALSITKEVTPPPPVSRPFSFSGPVRAISSPDPHNGIWKIGGHDVVVNGLTTISGNPAVGDLVDVKGHIEIGASAAAAHVMMPFSFKYVAERITKKR